MGSVMSLSCSKRKATSLDVGSESCKRRKICSTNDDENCRLIPDELSLKHPWSFCANRVAAAVGFFTPFTKFRFPQDTEDTKCSSLSLPSPPTTLSRTWKHHIFPSFHGADVRKTVLSHILDSFKRKGIDIFIDNNIERSKSIGPELIDAIRGSKIAIVLLSKNYASSSWCLDELAEIMNCREVLGQIVMTIFYEVDPTDIKKQTGDFGKAFRITCKGKTKEHIERWRKTLEDVATIAGEHSCKWNNEAAMIEKIATDVSNILNNSTPSRDFDGLVGMRTHMEEMKGLLRLDLDEVRMVGIWGPPGIGKTTIARVLFNQFSSRFQLGAIMVDIKGCYKRLCLDEYNAQLQLQNQMLSQIINQKNIKTSHLGVAPERLKDKKVFLVLDEVDHMGQLDALAKETRWFGPGSRIIITTENLRDTCELLSDDSTDSKRFIGINLDFSKTEEELNISEKALERMHDFQFVSINNQYLAQPERLQTVVQGLIYHSQKIRLLDWKYFNNICLPSTFNPEFLVEVNMRESKLEKLWEGTKPLINLKWMDLSWSTDLKELPDLSTATKLEELILTFCSSLLELPSSIGNATNLQKLYLSYCSNLLELPSSIGNATNLQKLDLSYCSNLLELPSSIGNAINLQELNLRGCTSLVKLPSSIVNATNLQKLDLSYCSNLLELPSIGNLTKLEELNLHNCSSLVKLPSSINALINLRELDLQNCSSLQELPPSIGTATNLKILNISEYSSLVKLPSSIGDLINLECFWLDNCSSLVELPSSIGNLQKLSFLRMCGCSKIEALPTNINLESLDTLDLTDCSQLKSFPEISTNINILRLTGTAIKEVPLSIMSWSHLSDFQMSYFEGLKEFQHAFDIITGLQFVNEDIKEVPPWVKGMSRLRELTLYNCNNLVSLPQFSDSLNDLVAENCQSLERLDCSFNNPKIFLQFVNCIKLNQEARDLIMHTSTHNYAILPGTEVPDCFNHRATGGSSLTFKLNDSTRPTSFRFKACFVLVKDEEEWGDDEEEWGDDEEESLEVNIDIMDKHKDLKVRCTPSKIFIDRLLTEHIYTFEVETKEMTSTEFVFEFKTDNSKWKIGECGLLQAVESE